MTSTHLNRRRVLAAGALLAMVAAACAVERTLSVPPRLTDDRLAATDPPHRVVYDAARQGAPLLVWLGGTGGQPATGPRLFYEAALRQGYRLVALSYLNTPAVSQACTGPMLRLQPACAGRMRQYRVWGEPRTDWLADRPEDAIVPRLTRLLQHLAQTDEAGHWAQYLDGGEPHWGRVVLAGQSQGGGMAAFIAQTRQVAGVIVFSGGWDREAGGDLADWYSRPSSTPLQRWHGAFHVQEAQAAALEETYRRLGLRAPQIHRLSQPVRGAYPHGEGISNPDYRTTWEQMLRLQD